jgi:hypothetical protein
VSFWTNYRVGEGGGGGGGGGGAGEGRGGGGGEGLAREGEERVLSACILLGFDSILGIKL